MISVLYVDDEPDLLDLGKLFLERDREVSVTTTESGPSALKILKNGAFDAIIADYQMPEMNGILLLREIRKISDIPFILFTGKGREDVVIDAINSGADFYLQKGGDPVAQFMELGHKVVQAVSRWRAERALHTRLDLIRQIAVTSTCFIRLPESGIDEAIIRTLAEIGLQYGADHCSISQVTEMPDLVTITHEWTAEGIEPLSGQFKTIPTADFPWLTERIRALDVINIPRVPAIIPPSDTILLQKRWLEDRGIQSLLILPLTTGPSVLGALVLDTVRQEISWPDEDVDILKIYGQIISSALARKLTEQTLRESEELYRTVFESTGTAMMILEEDKTIAVVNREMERISGYSRAEIEGKMPWTAFVSPIDLERMQKYHVMRRADPSSVPKNYEFGFLARNGKQISTYITVEMIPGTRKSIVSLIDISRESAARQELADSEEKFRGLAESLPEGIYMIQDNRFIYVNPAFCRLFRQSQETLKNMADFSEIFPEHDRARVKESVAERLNGIRDSERYPIRSVRRDGSTLSVIVHGSKTRYRGRPAIIGTVTEVRE